MKKLLFFVLILLSLRALGQTQLFGIRGGTNWTNVSASNFSRDNANKRGTAVGVTYEHIIRKHFSFGADLVYDQRGFINYLIFTDVNAKPTGRKEPTSFNYNYLSLPLKVGFSVGKKFYSFASLGVIPAVLLNARTKIPIFSQDSTVIGTATFNPTKSVSRFDLAGMAEIGFGYRFRKEYSLYSSVASQQSFTSITNSAYFPASVIRHYGTTVSLGIKHPIQYRAKQKPQL